ncbi:unnamed protein product [Rhizophagus irregularis]|nr:unnamed protein product [Rhizophagus irregularis]
MALPAGFVMPEFHGSEQDHEDFVDQFVAYTVNSGYNEPSVPGGLVREFDNKNWELQNVLDNSGIGVNIGTICDANAGVITGAVTSFSNVPLGLAGADIIPARSLDEDWIIAGGRPTNATGQN